MLLSDNIKLFDTMLVHASSLKIPPKIPVIDPGDEIEMTKPYRLR